MKIVPGPDFPTGGVICGRQGIVDAYTTGRGRSDRPRQGRTVEQTSGGKEQIIITEIPYTGHQDDHRREDRRVRQGRHDRGHRRRARRIGPRRHAPRRRAQEGRRPGRRPQPALPLHAAADTFSHHQHRPGERPPADAEPEARLLEPFIEHRMEVIRRRTPVPAEKAAATAAHILEGLLLAVSQHRRDHRDHQEVARRADGQART